MSKVFPHKDSIEDLARLTPYPQEVEVDKPLDWQPWAVIAVIILMMAVSACAGRLWF